MFHFLLFHCPGLLVLNSLVEKVYGTQLFICIRKNLQTVKWHVKMYLIIIIALLFAQPDSPFQLLYHGCLYCVFIAGRSGKL